MHGCGSRPEPSEVERKSVEFASVSPPYSLSMAWGNIPGVSVVSFYNILQLKARGMKLNRERGLFFTS